MSEHLVVRLSSHAHEKMYWLVWSSAELEVIASGEIENAEQLSSLQQRAGHRPVIALVPSVNVQSTQVQLPTKAARKQPQTISFLLEEQLAQDIEELHFALAQTSTSDSLLQDVWVVEQSKMAMWSSWLSDAGLICKQMLPDSLAVPYRQGYLSAARFDHQLLLRTAHNIGWSLDTSDVKNYLPLLPLDGFDGVLSWGAEEDLKIDLPIEQMDFELLMMEMAKEALTSSVNLMQGAFAPVKEASKFWKVWRPAVIAASIALVAYLGHQTNKLFQLDAQLNQTKQQVVAVYKTAFPNETKVPDPRKQMTLHLREFSLDTSGSLGLLNMMLLMADDFDKMKSLKVLSAKYDGKTETLKMSMRGQSFSDFEAIEEIKLKDLEFEVGTLNQQREGVTGTVTVSVTS